ncbi:MAG: hypothetical protein QOG89_1740 [Thermomicrobiales bacterium]|nr:hypothetical protein [Thermomicrobiales bacterium]
MPTGSIRSGRPSSTVRADDRRSPPVHPGSTRRLRNRAAPGTLRRCRRCEWQRRSGAIFEVRGNDLDADRQPCRREPHRSHGHREVNNADRLQPGPLVAVRAGRAVHRNGPGVDVGILVVRNRRGRRDRAQEHVVVAEEVGPRRLQPEPVLRRELVFPRPLRDVAGPSYGRRVVVGRRGSRPIEERLERLVRQPPRHRALDQALGNVVTFGQRDRTDALIDPRACPAELIHESPIDRGDLAVHRAVRILEPRRDTAAPSTVEPGQLRFPLQTDRLTKRSWRGPSRVRGVRMLYGTASIGRAQGDRWHPCGSTTPPYRVVQHTHFFDG